MLERTYYINKRCKFEKTIYELKLAFSIEKRYLRSTCFFIKKGIEENISVFRLSHIKGYYFPKDKDLVLNYLFEVDNCE